MTTTPATTTDATPDARPDVAAFVTDVRGRLGDLTADERDELLDGLEADLADQLADGAGELPDPATYAAELRAAAGLPGSGRPRRRFGPPRGDWFGDGLDRLRGWWLVEVDRHQVTRQAWLVVVALRPAWWVLRAWVAVELLDQEVGPYEPLTLVPRLQVNGLGPVVLLVAVVVSVLIGQGRMWPGLTSTRHGLSRAVLIVLNTVAVLGLISLVQHSADARIFPAGDYAAPIATPVGGVSVNGRLVHNLYPYDAQGQPLTGVQLFDGAGRPVSLSADQAQSGGYGSTTRVVACPWLNGTRRLFNVFPLPERVQRRGLCQAGSDSKLGPGSLPTPPLAQVPPVVLPTPAG